LFKIWLVVFVVVFVGLISSHSFSAQVSSDNDHCVFKSHPDGGEMRFVVTTNDVSMFIEAGFGSKVCEGRYEDVALWAQDRCKHLLEFRESSKKLYEQAFGLSIEQMCRAQEHWIDDSGS
jgi:hypothetical protein